MDAPLTLNDVPDSFLAQFVRNKRNATDKEIIDAYLEQGEPSASHLQSSVDAQKFNTNYDTLKRTFRSTLIKP
ncbi:3326_t:CDS:2 [Paraglomus brasilianum]|uniref:3326_t:CDS:1 n=1 Tax=Paraglomus brasilianum TaxID=144538 RepID=A0A9N9DAJ3_9GLOM|nr:3326_t:CDS:2 [Paraglomus brasilianum]